MEFCIASVLRDGAVTIGTFSDERARDAELNALMGKISMKVWPEYAKDGYNPSYAPYGCVVNVQLKDGRTFSERVDKGPWEPETPPGWDDVIAKFRANAELVLPRTVVDEAIETVSRLETLADLSTLMRLLRKP